MDAVFGVKHSRMTDIRYVGYVTDIDTEWATDWIFCFHARPGDKLIPASVTLIWFVNLAVRKTRVRSPSSKVNTRRCCTIVLEIVFSADFRHRAFG